MADIIQLLPDSIANQIAAGEVVQRPASVVKELMENSIDAGASQIKLIIKDSGKTLIQVVDDGKGMNDTDARMSFERHATSKIKQASDLFSIRTKGFRGEALASIAAIAQVEMQTKTPDAELGIMLLMEGSRCKKQEAHPSSTGTNIAVKNLFYNVPARRKFLKSDPVELKHINEEFIRLALAHPEIFFTFFHNGNEVYHLPKANLRQRIVGVFGKGLNDKLLPIEEETDFIGIKGFITKAEMAKRATGNQYLFVNNRFIRSNYLNHAVKAAYEQLIQPDQYPAYYVFLEIDPAKIDVNVHPTKTEIKFEDERLIYNYLKVSVRHSLGKYLMTPTIDFETDTNFGVPHNKRTDQNLAQPSRNHRSDADHLEAENLKSWRSIYDNLGSDTNTNTGPQNAHSSEPLTFESDIGTQKQPFAESQLAGSKDPYQIHNTYIINHIKSGFLLIDQQNAHERILYEENLNAFEGRQRLTQKELFPLTLELDSSKSEVFGELLPKLHSLGFEIGEFGKNTFLVHGIPADMPKAMNPIQLLEQMIDQYLDQLELQLGIDENIARSYAKAACIKRGTPLTILEMKRIIDDLFACSTPFISPSGHKCVLTYEVEHLKKKFI